MAVARNNTIRPAPEVAVVIAAHNAETTIEATLQSVLHQTYSQELLHIIICDDGSEDHTGNIVARYAPQYANITLLTNHQRQGIAAARNRLLKSVPKSAQYIAVLDADDICEPERIRTQVDHLESRPDAIGCVASATVIDATGRVVGQRAITEQDCRPRRLMRGNPLTHSTLMYRASQAAEFPYDETLPRGVDLDLYCRMFQKGERLLVEPRPLVQYRLHESGGRQQHNVVSFRWYARVRWRYLWSVRFFSITGGAAALVYTLLGALPHAWSWYLYKKYKRL